MFPLRSLILQRLDMAIHNAALLNQSDTSQAPRPAGERKNADGLKSNGD